MESAETLGESAAGRRGMHVDQGSVSALRQLSADDVLALQDAQHSFRPIVDGLVLPVSPRTTFEAGAQHRVPLIIGSNSDEGTIFTGDQPEMTVAQYHHTLSKQFGDSAGEVFSVYPAHDWKGIRAALAGIRGDSTFLLGARSVARLHRTVQSTYVYHFTWLSQTPRRRELGVHHGAEMAHVFGTLETRGEREEHTPSDAMMQYWVRFAATGDPNQPGQPAWRAYEPENDAYMEFGDRVTLRTALRKERLDLFERILSPKPMNAAERSTRLTSV